MDGDEIRVSVQPPKKKQRKSEDTEDADAKLAAMLQAQENRMGRATRGGGPKSKAAKKKATPRKKSSNKIRPEDDSDISGSDASGPKRRKAGGGFQKPFNLSAPLADVCGEPTVSCLLTRLYDDVSNWQYSFPGHRLSRSYGSISKATSCRIQRINGRSYVTRSCRLFSSSQR